MIVAYYNSNNINYVLSIIMLRHKYDAIVMIRQLRALIENDTKKTIKYVRTDRKVLLGVSNKCYGRVENAT